MRHELYLFWLWACGYTPRAAYLVAKRKRLGLPL